MDDGHGRYSLEQGMSILGSDGETVGEVDLVDTNYVIVKKGLFPQDHYIPVSDIVSQDEDGTLHLGTPAEEALERGLGNPSAGLAGDIEFTDTDTALTEPPSVDSAASAHPDADDMVDANTETAPPSVVDTDDAADPEVSAEPMAATAEVDDTDVDASLTEPETNEPETRDDMHRTVTLSEEELSATTRPVERGVVRVEKRIVEERQTLEVPLIDEEVEVTRRRVDREIREGDNPFEERTIEIPLHGEAVEIEKHAHVVEEIDIDKTAHERMQQVTETVRKETAEVETEGAEIVEETVDDASEEERRT